MKGILLFSGLFVSVVANLQALASPFPESVTILPVVKDELVIITPLPREDLWDAEIHIRLYHAETGIYNAYSGINESELMDIVDSQIPMLGLFKYKVPFTGGLEVRSTHELKIRISQPCDVRSCIGNLSVLDSRNVQH